MKYPAFAFHYADVSITRRPASRYPIHKFAQLVARVRERELLAEAHVLPGPLVSDELLLLAHTPAYVAKIRDGGMTDQEERAMGFCWSPNLYLRGNRIVGSTVENCRAALRDGIAFTLGGGAHHSFSDVGRGYCVFNDLACAALHLLESGVVRRVAILDCDVHQGDGTARILGRRRDVFCCSIHGASNYPFHKETSHLDIELEDGCGDERYLAAVRAGLDAATSAFRPDLLLYIAGADPFEEDRLGRLRITAAGLAARDTLVFRQLYELEIPVAVVFGGGYCDPIDKTVELNLRTIELGCERMFGNVMLPSG